ncbi:MAG: TRAP transporter permease, partial [Pseudomonadota bacterium]
MSAENTGAPLGAASLDAPLWRAQLERGVVIGATLLAIALSIHQLFNLRLFGVVLIEGRYLYLLAGLFLAVLFL